MTAAGAIMGADQTSAPAPLTRPGADTERVISMRRQSITVEDRFWAKVDKNGPVPERRPDLGPCWLWKGATSGGGYGHFSVDGLPCRAHRFSYELLVGPIPDGLVTDHLCVNPPCVNPAHLEPVTQLENIMRGDAQPAVNARKTHCKRGHPLSGDNLRLTTQGRVCRTCIRQQKREARIRHRASLPPFIDPLIGRMHMSEQTLGEAIVAAHKGVAAAELELQCLLTQARRDGVTLRRLSELLGVAPSTVMRWAPLEDDEDSGAGDPLNQPVSGGLPVEGSE